MSVDPAIVSTYLAAPRSHEGRGPEMPSPTTHRWPASQREAPARRTPVGDRPGNNAFRSPAERSGAHDELVRELRSGPSCLPQTQLSAASLV